MCRTVICTVLRCAYRSAGLVEVRLYAVYLRRLFQTYGTLSRIGTTVKVYQASRIRLPEDRRLGFADGFPVWRNDQRSGSRLGIE